jgi:ATP-dependent exoDNAse (exonuclease V) alpha subunit
MFLQEFTFILGYKLHVAVVNKCSLSNFKLYGTRIQKSASSSSVPLTYQFELRDALFSVSDFTAEIRKEELYFAVGDKVVVTENLSTPEGIVNGSRGTVKFFVYTSVVALNDSRPPLAVGKTMC